MPPPVAPAGFALSGSTGHNAAILNFAPGSSYLKRPSQQPQRGPRTDAERRALAARALYVGSKEHKDKHWWGGLPGARYGKDGEAHRPKRQRTTICPLVTPEEQEKATAWIRAAIQNQQCTFLEGDQDFPKHVWYEAEGGGWFGYCINSVAGHYKGWPLEEEERREIFGK